MSIKKDLIELMKNKEQFTTKEAYEELADYQKHSVRARIYENTGLCFEKIGRGIKARALRPDKKKIKATGEMHYMSGANAIVPTLLDYEPPSKNEIIHQAEKPSELIIKLLELFSLDGEVCLDQFAGNGSTGEACIKSNRAAILIELLNENVEKIKDRLIKAINKKNSLVAE